QHPDERLFEAATGEVHGGKGERQDTAFIGTVEDFPIAEITVAAERNGARADPSQWKGDLAQGLPGEAPAGSGPGRGCFGGVLCGGQASGSGTGEQTASSDFHTTS